MGGAPANRSATASGVRATCAANIDTSVGGAVSEAPGRAGPHTDAAPPTADPPARTGASSARTSTSVAFQIRVLTSNSSSEVTGTAPSAVSGPASASRSR
ncbi:hypothetical protein [Nocardia farcinica]|uniref:hypothetical protein n=1 Tax=Nocardia farcinica TaxID=37329 RepID=UPI002B4B51DD|nr:hypothetical protein [Nocardia farcinica]